MSEGEKMPDLFEYAAQKAREQNLEEEPSPNATRVQGSTRSPSRKPTTNAPPPPAAPEPTREPRPSSTPAPGSREAPFDAIVFFEDAVVEGSPIEAEFFAAQAVPSLKTGVPTRMRDKWNAC